MEPELEDIKGNGRDRRINRRQSANLRNAIERVQDGLLTKVRPEIEHVHPGSDGSHFMEPVEPVPDLAAHLSRGVEFRIVHGLGRPWRL